MTPGKNGPRDRPRTSTDFTLLHMKGKIGLSQFEQADLFCAKSGKNEIEWTRLKSVEVLWWSRLNFFVIFRTLHRLFFFNKVKTNLFLKISDFTQLHSTSHFFTRLHTFSPRIHFCGCDHEALKKRGPPKIEKLNSFQFYPSTAWNEKVWSRVKSVGHPVAQIIRFAKNNLIKINK